MATAQYADANEAYNRAVNLNPNDPQIWCSLGKNITYIYMYIHGKAYYIFDDDMYFHKFQEKI
jgi:hypothetical protein